MNFQTNPFASLYINDDNHLDKVSVKLENRTKFLCFLSANIDPSMFGFY